MRRSHRLHIERDLENWREEKDGHALSPTGIARQDDGLLRRYRDFRRAADALAAAWRSHPEEAAVTLIGSVRRSLGRKCRALHPIGERGSRCGTNARTSISRYGSRTRATLTAFAGPTPKPYAWCGTKKPSGVASHEVDAFVLEPGTDRYLGRLCDFNYVPRARPSVWCRAVGSRSFCAGTRTFAGGRRLWRTIAPFVCSIAPRAS